VRGVVEHVHVGMLVARRLDTLDEATSAARSPARSCAQRCRRPIRIAPSPQELDTALRVEVRVALEVEEQVARARRRQPSVSALGLRIEVAVHRQSDSRDSRCSIAWWRSASTRSARETGDGVAGSRSASAASATPRRPRGVPDACATRRRRAPEVVGPPAPLALAREPAYVAVRRRLGVGDPVAGGHGGLEPALAVAVQSRVAAPAPRAPSGAVTQDHVRVRGGDALHRCHQAAVQRQLVHGRRAHVAGELGCR